MITTLLRGGRIHTAHDPSASCVAITDGVISWIGPEHGIEQAGSIDEIIDLDGLFVAPAFIDSHVHCTDAGLALNGLDLSGTRSVADCLNRLREFASSHQGGVVWGHGWDDSNWPDQRPPSRAEIDEIVGGRVAYLARIDVHSAVVSTGLHRQLDQSLPGFALDGILTQSSHRQAQDIARGILTTPQRDAAQISFLSHCAANGMIEVHECAFRDHRSLAELTGLLALPHRPVQVRAYLGTAVSDPDEARALLESTGAHALGGDLSVDGSIGSRTAALCHPYSDADGSGVRYLSTEVITQHLLACARAGIQPGFHAIGDDAVNAVAEGLIRAAETLGPSGTVALAAVTPRIEHAEMAGEDAIAAFAATGTVASVQPLFDAYWGGETDLYAKRLGLQRSTRMNPFSRLAAAGVTLAFGSDAPVTPANPWAAVQAAVNHRTPGFGVTPRAAFTAHTRGAHRAAGRTDRGIGTITIGAPADLAIWQAGELVRPESAEKLQRWSTDPQSRVPLLPDLQPGAELPTCVSTIAAGRVSFDSGLLSQSRLM